MDISELINCLFFINRIESNLCEYKFLVSNKISIADIAIFPFIRQFAFVDKDWFDKMPYKLLQKWLTQHLESELFLSVMQKYGLWEPGDDVIFFENI